MQGQQPNIFEQISQMVGQSVQQAYQSRFSLISTAASLAVVSNWKSVLSEEITSYEEAMRKQCEEKKDMLQKQVPAEQLLEARSVITDTVELALRANREHYDSLVSMIERLTADTQ